MRSVIKSSVIVLAFLCFSPFLKAQPGEPGDGGPDPDPVPEGTGAPLDLGLTLLVAAGVGYAAKRRYDIRMKEKSFEGTQK